MLTLLLAHDGPSTPGELWSAWPVVPLVWIGLTATVVVYLRGPYRRAGLFGAAMVAIALALASPLDPLSHALASAHMVQHLLLIAIAAPLLAWGAVPSDLLRGHVRLRGRGARLVASVRRGLRGREAAAALALAGLHSVTVWCWHAAGPYDAAVHHDALHALEHLTLLATGLAAWWMILGAARHRRGRAAAAAVLALFGLSLQSAILGALLTFARAPWYDAYAGTTATWGLSDLEDQQLAGVLMWVPGGVTYLVAALVLVGRWIEPSTPERGRVPATSDQTNRPTISQTRATTKTSQTTSAAQPQPSAVAVDATRRRR